MEISRQEEEFGSQGFFFSKAADGGGPTGRLVVEFPYRTKGALKEMEPILGASNKQQMF